MHLKRLIVHGFKSFAERTEFEFRPGGLTCVVGPNGCGKSNVIDAVKWVLGEQRPTSLRGKEMTDVIFNGTVRRPPMGLCEGTLVFDNASGTLPGAEEEVRVTRRVFRTGETEYLVNGRQVRLKDVRDIFAGTGLGTGGYAFMEQGKIDSVLAGNPVDRRRVFEEAAGISRFRARKHETGLKLQRVEENLTRLADVIEEVNRQIRSLRVHAGKARSWREMTERVHGLQKRFSLHRYGTLLAEQESAAGHISELTAVKDDLARARDELREAMHEVESELERLVEGVSAAREGYAAVTGRLAATREKIGFHARYREELLGRLEQKQREIDDTRHGLAALREEHVLVVREREAMERDLVRVTGVRGLEEQQVDAVRGRGLEIEAARSAAEESLRNLEQRIAEVSRREARLEAEIAHHQSRIAELESQGLRLEGERDEHRRGLEERTGHQDAQTTALEERRLALTGAERRSEALDAALADAADSLRRLESDLGRMQARRDVLEGHLRRREGLDEGTRALLEEKDRRPEFLPGLEGLLLELFDVDLSEARAVEAALGDAAGALVVADAAEALEALRFLREGGRGGALLLPLDRFADVPLRALNGIRPASEDVARILSALVGGIEILGRTELESRLLEGGASGPLLVSAEGEVLRDGRVLHAPRGGESSTGLIVLAAELKGLERKLPGLTSARDEARARVHDARADRDASRLLVKELSVALLKEEGDAARLDQEIVRLVRELERLNAEVERLRDDERSAAGALAQARAQSEDEKYVRQAAEEAVARAAAAVAGHRERITAHRDELERALAALHAAQVEAATTGERLEAARGREVWLLSSADEMLRRLAAAESEVLDLGRARDQAGRTVAEETARQASLEQESAATSRTLEDRERAADGVRDDLRAVAERLDTVESDLGGLSDRMAAARGREGEVRASLENLLQHAREDLGLDLALVRAAEARADAALEDAGAAVPALDATAAAPAAETPGPDAAEAPIDWKQVEAEIRELKERIVRLGNVNLAAVEELDEAERRAEFIHREREDLDRSREELKRILKNIETQSTAMFLETFNAVREHFAVIFRKLFGGGKADITLENPELPLECGIDIKARPPGKELRSITLLSGGERSMTAVALLFAIFKAHPCPCAFMDEVDAALDEDNTERFVRLVEESRERAQFIVVTHSKRTMEHAGLLYGVTMPERGVSRRVSVRLEQVDDQGRLRDLEAVNREAARQAATGVLVSEVPAAEVGHAVPVAAEVAARAASEEESGMVPLPAEEPVLGALEVPAFAHRAKSPRPKKAAPPPEASAAAEA